MAITYITGNEHFRQSGDRFTLGGSMVSSADAADPDSGTIKAFSAFDATPYNDGRTFSSLRITHAWANTGGPSASQTWVIKFDATADVEIFRIVGCNGVNAFMDVDFTTMLDKGFADPKGSSFSGDLLVSKFTDDAAGAAVADWIIFFISGYLMP